MPHVAALTMFFVYKAAVTDFISFKMPLSRLPILSKILTHFFKKVVTVTAFNCDHYVTSLYDGYINISVNTLLTTDRELLYKVLQIIRKTLYQGPFVAEYEFGHANEKVREGNYIQTGSPLVHSVKEVTDENLPFDWSEVSNGKLPFEWSCYLPETTSEDRLHCTEVYDDGSIAAQFSLNYSIAMVKKECRSNYKCKNSAHIDQVREDLESLWVKNTQQTSAHIDQLREDIETLWGKNTQLTSSFCVLLQGMDPYSADLFASGQDTYISASVVRALK